MNNSDDGWGACAHQFAMDHPIDAEAGEANMFSKDPKEDHILDIQWTPYEKLSLPASYEEAIARLLTLKHLRNLIETQEI